MPNPFTALDDDSDDETVVVKTTTVVVNKEKPFVLSACPCPKAAVVQSSPTKRWADYDTDDDE